MTLYIYWLKDSERLSKSNGGIPESTGRSREEERHQTGIAENVQSNLKIRAAESATLIFENVNRSH
jgi:hypothetical protein